MDNFFHKSQYTLYFENFVKTLYALYYGMEGVFISYFMELTLRSQKTLVFFPFKFQGPKRRPNHLPFYGGYFSEGTRLGAKEASKRRPKGHNRGAHV